MGIFNIGPDGWLLVIALIVSAVVAAFTWRRVGLTATSFATASAAIVCGAWLVLLSTTTHPVLVALFVLVPSALLLGVSRVGWIARHAWVLLLAGPVVFVGCYVGLCEFCVKSGLI